MTHEERAAVIIEELNTYNHINPVAWLAEALRSFERELDLTRACKECRNRARAAAVQIPDGEDL